MGELLLPAMTLTYPELAANGSLWAIRYDFYYYLLIGAVGWTGLLARRWPVSAMFAASFGVYAYWFTSGAEGGLYDQDPRFLTCFLAGAVAYSHRRRIPLRWTWLAASIAVLAVAAAVAGLPQRKPPYRLMSLAFPICGAYAVLFACFRPGARAAKLAWLGDYSYGLFLYAYPIQLMVLSVCRARLNPYAHFLIAWPLGLLAARLSLCWIERPAMRLRPRRPAERRDTPAPHFHVQRAEEPAAAAVGEAA